MSAPEAICALRGLVQIEMIPIPSSIYFLCDGDEVVYVGQSVRPAIRALEHLEAGQKKFDRVYAIPVERERLDEVESAFILALRPRFNGRAFDNRNKLCLPVRVADPLAVIADFRAAA